MSLQALLLSHDDDVLRTVRRVLNDLGMKVEICTGAERAAEWLERRKYDVAVVDVDGMPGAAAVLHGIRQSPSNRNTVTFAILGGATTPQQAFAMGAQLALEKPLSMDRAVRGFRAANVLVLGERRHFFRHKVEMPVTVKFGDTELQATATDISEGGMAIRIAKPLEVTTSVELRFVLPGRKTWIGTSAVVAWADEEGRAGVKFEHLPEAGHTEFEHWVLECAGMQEAAPTANGTGAKP
jgi:DNA-binding response OmpR family regulator